MVESEKAAAVVDQHQWILTTLKLVFFSKSIQIDLDAENEMCVCIKEARETHTFNYFKRKKTTVKGRSSQCVTTQAKV